MMFANVFLALAAGWGMLCLMREKLQRLLAALLTLALCTVCVYPQLGSYAVRSADMTQYGARNADPYFRYKSYTSTIASSYLEYRIPGSDLSATKDQKVRADERLQQVGYHSVTLRVGSGRESVCGLL